MTIFLMQISTCPIIDIQCIIQSTREFSMENSQLAIFIIEGLNVLVTALFLFLYIRRLCKISSRSVTNKYLDRHWVIRLVIAILYILISALMLSLELVKYVDESNWVKELLLSGSVGFCINSLILVAHITVISQELRKEIPFTRLHQMFLGYLVAISMLRLGIIIYQFQKNMEERFEVSLLTLSISLTGVSIFMLVYWYRKKKTVPEFDDLSKVDINTITERITNPILYDHNSISPERTSIQRWNLIIPNVTVETGKVRIILEMMTQDEILKSLANEETKSGNYQKEKSIPYRSMNNNSKGSRQQHLEIISDKLYSILEIKNIYLVCSRFDIEAKIDFEGASMGDFFRQAKKFMQELFSIKQCYVPQIFELFVIDKPTIAQLNAKVHKMIKFEDDLLVSNYVDHNALFLSIEVFKHFWVQDHFIFYIQTLTMDQKEKTVCYKRFTDFEEFHHKLLNIVLSQYKGPYLLPDLPKKHFFSFSNSDFEKAKQRRHQLQNYCQQCFNDYNMMVKMPRARQLTLNFLGLKKAFEITPNSRRAIQFYDGLEIKKGSIYKALVQEEYVTFYEFQLYRNGILIRSIFKRFRQFIALHKSLTLWMENCQVLYKFLVLPEKHLYKSQTIRHEKLINYLQSIVMIKDAYKIHEVNKFFNMGHHNDNDNSGFGMSIIKRIPSDMEENGTKEKQYDFSMESEKQRMSLLIQELGDEG